MVSIQKTYLLIAISIGFLLSFASKSYSQCTSSQVVAFDDFETVGNPPFVSSNANFPGPPPIDLIFGNGASILGAFNGALGLWIDLQTFTPSGQVVYNRPFTVCPNQSYFFQAWIGGTTDADYITDIYDGTNINGVPIASYNSFETWVNQTIGPFSNTSGTITMVIRNNIAGAFVSRHFRMDDLSLQLCDPDTVDNPINLCPGSGQTSLFSNLSSLMNTTGTWSGPSVLSGGYLGNFDPSTMLLGTYEYTEPANGVCPALTETVTISSITPDLVTTPIVECSAIGANITTSFIDNNATGGTVTYWQDSLTTVTEPTPANITTSGTYYIVMTDGGCADTANVSVIINPNPVITAPLDSSYCAGITVPASAYTSVPAGATYDWFHTNTTVGLGAGTSGNTPAFTATNITLFPDTTTVSAYPTLNGCVGDTTNYLIVINPIPVAPTAVNKLVCINNTATLNATDPGGTYEWFDAATGGTLLFTGASYTTPILTANDTFWVQTTTLNCTSPRTEVTVTIGNGLIIDAGLDVDICPGDTTILTALPNSISYTYAWSEPTFGVIDTFINQLVFPLDTTMYTLQVTDTFGCIEFDTVNVNVKPIPVVIVPNDSTYCNGEVVFPSNYSSIPLGASYNWTNSDTAVGLLDQFGIMNTPGFAATNPTTVPIISTISVVPSYLGCTGNPTDYTITVNPIPTLATPPSNTYCIGDVVPPSNINGTPSGVSFSWTNSNPVIGLDTSGLSDVPSFITTNTSTLSITGIIVVTPTANGCIGNPINYSITVPAPIIIDKVIKNATCFGDRDGEIRVIPSGGNPGYTYSWTSGDTDSIASNLSAGPNTITVTDANNCMQDSTFIVTQRDSIDYIDFNAVPDNGCSPLEVNFTTQINPVLHLIDNYVWNFGNNLLPIDSFNANSIYIDPGSYDVSLTITDNAGCSNTLTKTNFVTVHEDPQAFFNTFPDDPTMFNTTIDFDDASIVNIVSWEWAFDTLGFSSLQNPSFTFPEDSGNYLVTLIAEDDNTCRDTITKNIFIRSEIALFFPNSFTPDGDRVNDVFIPKGFGVAIENYSFTVFNLWGEIVFQTNDSQEGWDGFFKGELSPIDVYPWRAEFRDLNGNNYKRDGHLNLVR